MFQTIPTLVHAQNQVCDVVLLILFFTCIVDWFENGTEQTQTTQRYEDLCLAIMERSRGR